MIYDITGKGVDIIDTDSVSDEVEVIKISKNKISKVPHKLSSKLRHVDQVFMNNNLFCSISFLKMFRCLSLLDISDNPLTLSSLFSIRNCVIGKLFVNLDFQNSPNYKPIILTAILPKVWIINNVFITDYQRKLSKEYESSKRYQAVTHEFRASMKVDDSSDMCVETSFMSPKSQNYFSLVNKPQFQRIHFLSDSFKYVLPFEGYSDIFYVVLGILSSMWLNEGVSLIPEVFCSSWGMCRSEIMMFSEYELLLLLYKIDCNFPHDESYESELYLSLNIQKYIRTGKPPLPGSTPRLIITSFLSRAASQLFKTLKSKNDVTLYINYREKFGLRTFSNNIEEVYSEFIIPIYADMRDLPDSDNIFLIRNPITNENIQSVPIALKNGKVVIKDHDIILQAPISSFFWDGRGVWKESSIKKKIPKTPKSPPPVLSPRTFITSEDPVIENHMKTISPVLPPLTSRIAPASRSTYINMTRNVFKESKFIDRSPRQHVSFRGIADPPFPPRKPPKKIVQNKLTYIDQVINVVPANEVADGIFLRKFLVKITNQLTNKSTFQWIDEDDIPEDDIQNLLVMYRNSIERKSKKSQNKIYSFSNFQLCPSEFVA